MGLKVWMDGKLVDQSDAKIGVYDHGLLYGDGVFEGIRLYHGKIFAPAAHLDRFFQSAKAIRLAIPYTAQQLREAIELTARTNNFAECYVRLVATRGIGNLGLNPASCPKPAVFIIADLISLYPAEMYEKGMAVITARTIRNHPAALSPRIKSLNYLNNVLAKIEANDAGVPEAIMLNHQGNVAECTADNIFIVRSGQVQTPATSDGVLEGITRQTIIGLCHSRQIPLVEKTLQLHDLYIADECFLTGTGAEVIPVTRIDRISIGPGTPGPITQKLIEAFRRYVKEA
ncbi:MAG TPA: branched-chain-amino-acid transaminase [Tepidisphaeraceae bacterium]|jgi:branched-chain amino acid aminotransferase|nr:branched-chain-amino-acid transaminase [Tepidisphaeraceae bacterium]